MNKQLRRVSLVIAAMFLSLFVSSTTLQVISADALNSDQRNVRSVYDSYETQRGAILVDGQPIASSTKTDVGNSLWHGDAAADDVPAQLSSPAARNGVLPPI